MLIVHRLSSGAHRYYLGSVGPAGGDAPALGEAPGRWAGSGATALGLTGEVAGADLRRVLRADPGRLPGLDLTFAAPKSVSILHGLGSPPVAQVVRRAHDAAVAAGLAYLEEHACVIRLGMRLVEGGGLTVACFRHRVSRADDPHLHTHALVANRAEGEGVGRALHTPLIYAEQRAAGAVYHAALRHRLAAELGVTWEPSARCRADIAEVPAAVRAAFSRRRAAVLATGEAMADRRWAERVTRPGRPELIDAAGLERRWRLRAEDLGWRASLPGVGRRPAFEELALTPPSGDRWTRGDVITAIVDRLPDGADPHRLRSLCDRVLGAADVVPLGRPGGRHAAERFTTVSAVHRRNAVRAALEGSVVDGAPEALDRLRRDMAGDGREVAVVTADTASAMAVSDRAGVIGVAAEAAPMLLEGLTAGDLVVVDRPDRLPSAAVDAVLAGAARHRLEVVAAEPGRPAAPGAGPAVGPVATVPAPGGALTVAATAGDATATAIDDWLTARRRGGAPVLVAAGREVEAVNARARAALRAAGGLSPDELAGFAAGDLVRFTRPRPALGVSQHQTGKVVGVDGAAGRVVVQLNGDRLLSLARAQLTSLRYAHAVPPLPMLLAGRDEVLVLGGVSVGARHLAGHEVHRYVTSSAAFADIGPPVADRRTALPGLRARAEMLREPSRLPPDPTAAERRVHERAQAAGDWVRQADDQWRAAGARRDPAATRAWDAQRAAARRQAAAVEGERASIPRLREERRQAEERTAPARRALRSLEVQQHLQAEAVVRAAELSRATALVLAGSPMPDDPLERRRWREDAGAEVLREGGRSAEARQLPGQSIGHGIA